MNIIIWCGKKLQSAYAICKRAICFWKITGDNDDEMINDNYAVQNIHANGKSVVKIHIIF